jgi:hypothetical protein
VNQNLIVLLAERALRQQIACGFNINGMWMNLDSASLRVGEHGTSQLISFLLYELL